MNIILSVIVRKSIRLHRFIKHNLLNFFNYKVSDYDYPTKPIVDIGFFDSKRNIHIDKNYHHLFANENLHTSGSFNYYKKNTISIVEINGMPLIKKRYSGFYKNDKFYNEIICLDRLRSIKQTPNINYIDYYNKVVYMDFIDGINLFRKNNLKTQGIEISSIEKFKEAINLIHDNKIAIIDVGGQNMIINNNDYYIIDFADSFYFSKINNLCNSVFDHFASLDFIRFENYFK
jgi:hypothetical protein